MTSKSSIVSEGCLCTALCNIRTCVLSCRFKRHHYCLKVKHLNKTSHKVWKCMDQQHSAFGKHTKCFSWLPLFLTLCLSGLNRHWSIIRISIRLDQQTVCWMLDQPSTHQYLTWSFNRSAGALPRFCNSRTKVCNIRESQPHRLSAIYNWSLASRVKLHDGCVCSVHGALARCTFKT